MDTELITANTTKEVKLDVRVEATRGRTNAELTLEKENLVRWTKRRERKANLNKDVADV